MAKVSDMIAVLSGHAGDAPLDIDNERALEIAGEMRALLEAIYRFTCVCDSDEMLAAWAHLNAMERDAWKRCVDARGRNVGN